jgi:hypothetical protein
MSTAIFKQRSCVVATFASLDSAGQGLDQLVLAGFPVAKFFLLGKDLSACERNGIVIHGFHTDDATVPNAITGIAQGLTKGLIAGNAIGGGMGVLLGLGILTLPGVGQIAWAGAIAFMLLSGGIGMAAGGAIGALVGLELTERQAKFYSEQLSQGNYLLIVRGTEQEIQCAERILKAERIYH